MRPDVMLERVNKSNTGMDAVLGIVVYMIFS
jgi:hypothetical protein